MTSTEVFNVTVQVYSSHKYQHVSSSTLTHMTSWPGYLNFQSQHKSSSCPL